MAFVTIGYISLVRFVEKEDIIHIHFIGHMPIAAVIFMWDPMLHIFAADAKGFRMSEIGSTVVRSIVHRMKHMSACISATQLINWLKHLVPVAHL